MLRKNKRTAEQEGNKAANKARREQEKAEKKEKGLRIKQQKVLKRLKPIRREETIVIKKHLHLCDYFLNHRLQTMDLKEILLLLLILAMEIII